MISIIEKYSRATNISDFYFDGEGSNWKEVSRSHKRQKKIKSC